MIINDKNAFTPFVINMLTELGYEKVEAVSGKAYDITAIKEGKKMCFKCQYDIDAISEKKMQELVEGTKGAGFDEVVFVTNSSFISAAKKLGDKEGISLWDRNTVDRMYIGVKDKFDDDITEDTSTKKGIYIGIAVLAIAIVAAAAYFFIFR